MMEERISEKTPTSSTAKTLNTTIIASKAVRSTNTSERLQVLMRSPAFQFILQSIRTYALTNRVSEQEAAQDFINTLRELDSVWDDYIYQEGLEKLKSQLYGQK